MGNFLYGGKRPTSIIYQGKDVQILKYNGVTVWERFAPVTKTFYGRYVEDGDEGKVKEYYITPAGATVMRVKHSYQGTPMTSYIKINQQQKLTVFFDYDYAGGNSGIHFEIIVLRPIDNFEHGPGATSVERSDRDCEMELSFSKEINEHNFSDNTSDHVHLDWTK